MQLLSLYVQNYRTLENLTFNFIGNYSAVCGRNNSGKSNLIRAIRLLFSELDRFTFREDLELSYKSDFPAWKKDKATKETIIIRGSIKIDRIADQGLVEFIESLDDTKTKIKKGQKEYTLSIEIELNAEAAIQQPKVTIGNEVISDNLVAQEIYKKLKNAVIFHNSTMTHQIYFSRRRRLHGILSKIPEGNKKKVDAKAQGLKKEVNKVFKDQAAELQEMLGRLGDKYEVKFDTPDFDYDEYPFSLSLGYKDFNVPLDDWGSGTRNQTLIIKNIFEAKNSVKASSISDRITPLVLIEEPESFLHPLAQAQFSDALQALANEWKIQVIATTHSPYLLSHNCAESNILLDRKRHGRSKIFQESVIIPAINDDWKKPFEHALGICGPEFDVFKAAIFSQANLLIMVEGETDKEYFELCRKSEHTKHALTNKGEIFAYGGKDTLKNNVLLKFIRDRFVNVIITSDLDAENELSEGLKSLGFEKDKKYFPIGINQAGKRAIEGLVPERIRKLVQQENTPLIDALASDNKEEIKKAKNELKRKYLEKFKAEGNANNGDYDEFYKLCRKINAVCV